ncbi:MAG TPA: putative LPS assembly protein LptD [Flavipsychrobacter sp.]|nr:putative LPS assembly protein LptD [Flavipsychrobacter sp.]
MAADTLLADSLSTAKIQDSLGIKISEDALSAVVTAEATDSAVMDMKKKTFYLFGDANIKYEEMELKAGAVTYHQASNMVTAAPGFDSSGSRETLPEFTQGQEKFTYDTLQYNFKSKRAIVRNARAQHGEGYVFSEQIKRNPDQSIYGWQNVYTTCALDTPHFGIRARKIKIIPNRVIASGAANFVIQQIPTPLYLPFGLFPISTRQRSGFVLPTYTIEQARGLGLVNGGYYFYLNDYADVLFQANIFTKGSYAVSGVSTYSNRYKYNGGISLSFANNKTGESYEPGAVQTRDFRVNWRHATDPKARPGVNFSASVDMGTNSYYSNNSYNANQILQNNYLSTISFSRNWAGKPYSLTVNASYNQNTANNQTIFRLPELNFYVAQFNPFQSKNRIGTPKWYEKITTSYNFSAINETTFYDSSFSFNTISFDDFRNGFKHSIPISASYTVLRYINLSFNAPYTEYWFTNRNYRYYNVFDDKIDTITNRGFFTARDFNASVSMSTRIYGQKMFKKGKLMGIRHVLTPNVGFSYVPDFAARPFRYYYQTQLDGSNTPTYISPFEGSVIGTPGYGQYGNYASNVNFGINNNLQIKTRSKKDTTGLGKNVTLIDGFSITSAYNIAADSFNWQMVNMDFRTTITDKLSISANASFDPYDYDFTTRRRSTKTVYENGKGIARFMGASVSMQSSLRSTTKKAAGPVANTDEYQNLMRNGGYNEYVDFNVPWNINVSYTLSVTKTPSQFRDADTMVFNQNAMFGGDVNITPRWKLAVSSGYNFTTKQLQFTSIDIYRDLHCFEMHLQSFPFGPRKSYNFTLNAKASVLQDLRLLRRRDYRDSIY